MQNKRSWIKGGMILLLFSALMLSGGIMASAETEGYYTYRISNDTAEITDVDTSISGDITIPSTLGGYPVTSVGSYAFSYCKELTSVTIPEGVTSIGYSAFSSCENLISVDIPNSVTSIGSSAFSYCENLQNIKLPDGLTAIESSTFSYCDSLSAITIPKGVTKIDSDAFRSCNSLKTITVADGNEYFFAENNILYDKNKTTIVKVAPLGVTDEFVIPDGITNIGSYAFSGCNGLTSVVIPNSVTSIGSSAFSYCENLQNIKLSDGLTAIESSTFWYCSSLSAITIPKGVTKIGNGAFSNCESLQNIELPDGLISIESSTFSHCSSLTAIAIPKGVTKIGGNAFYGCKSLQNIELPDGLIEIGYSVFSSCENLVSVDIPNSVTKIDSDAFRSCNSLQTITVAEGNEYYTAENNVLYDKNKTTLIKAAPLEVTDEFIIPDSVTTIDSSAFGDCVGLTSVVIPDSVTKIGWDAFSGCESLQSIKLPDGLTVLEMGVFSGCLSLSEITIPKGVTEIGWDAFEECKSLRNIELPDGLIKIEGSAFSDCSSLTAITIPASVTDIGSYVFSRCESLQNIKLPDGLIKIGGSAFSYCSSLSSITIPKGVTEIDSSAFSDCNSLQTITVAEGNEHYTAENNALYDKNKTTLIKAAPLSVTGEFVIPGSVTKIEGGAFENCKNLRNIEMPDGLTAIERYTFQGCSALTAMTIPKGVTIVDPWAFNGCDSLESITVVEGNEYYFAENNVLYDKTTVIKAVPLGVNGAIVIPDGITSIGMSAFENCSGLTSIVIPDGVTELGSYAFRGCSSLTDINLPDSVTKVGYAAFQNCKSLTSTTLSKNITKLENSLFGGCSSLTEIHIPASVTSIGVQAFSWCDSVASITVAPGNPAYTAENNALYDKNKTTLIKAAPLGISGEFVIPKSVLSIDDEAFRGCGGLTELKISEGVTSIGQSAFYNCSNLKSITIPASLSVFKSNYYDGHFDGCSSLSRIIVSEKNEHFTTENNVLFNKDKTVLLAAAPAGVNGKYVVPDSVTSISNRAFSDCSGLTSIVIPNRVTSISDYVFYGCAGLTEIEIPDSMTDIGVAAFMSCSNLKQVSIPANTTNIGARAFAYCDSLESITVDPDNPAYMAENNILFNKDKTRLIMAAPLGVTGDYIIPEGVNTLEEEAFYSCKNLTGISIPANTTNIGERAFVYCNSLESITVDPGNPSYMAENNVLFDKDKTRLIMAAQAGVIGNYIIPEGVKTLEMEAFAFCKNLTGISIPASVTDISRSVFNTCDSLQTITVAEDNEYYIAENNILYDKNKTTLIKAAPLGVTGDLVLPDSVTGINSSAFNSCNSLTGVTIPASLNTIEEYTFTPCKNLEHITVDPGNQSFTAENNVLFSKDKTRLLIASRGLTGDYTIPDSVRSVDPNAFQSCGKMTGITIPAGLTDIGNGGYTFLYCDSLKQIVVASDNPTYTAENNVLFSKDKTKLLFVVPASVSGEYIVPPSVTSIEDSSIRNCTNMTSVVIPISVTNIGSYAFMGSSALTDVYYAGTQEQWKAIAIAKGNDPLLNAALHFESTGGASGVRDLTAEQVTNDSITLRFTPPENAETLQLEQSVDRRTWTAAQTEAPLTPQSNAVVVTGLTADTTYYFRLWVTGGEKAGVSNVVQAKTAQYTAEEDFTVENGTVTDYTGQGTAAVIPPEINGVPVTAVGVSAFEGSDLTNIVLPDTVTIVEAKAFSKSAKLKSVTIPYSVTAIASDALEGCGSLTEIVYSGNPKEWDTLKAQLDQLPANMQIQFVPNVNTAVSSDGGQTTFTVAARNIPQQSEIILALYKNNQLVETTTAIYDGQNISFTTTADYDAAKVLAWDSLDAMTPVCEFDIIQGN